MSCFDKNTELVLLLQQNSLYSEKKDILKENYKFNMGIIEPLRRLIYM